MSYNTCISVKKTGFTCLCRLTGGSHDTTLECLYFCLPYNYVYIFKVHVVLFYILSINIQ